MTLNQSEISVAVSGFIISAGDAKGITVPAGQNLVRIPEKKIGKGKGKTVAFCLVPNMEILELKHMPLESELKLCEPMLVDVLEELQRDIIIRMSRDGSKAVTPTDISINACAQEYANRKFSPESVAFWFDNEMREYLELLIATAKGWEPAKEVQNAISGSFYTLEQETYLNTKCAAYRASYMETAARFPKLDPVQVTELLRVLDLTEATGAVPAAIRLAVTPKATTTSLGF